MTYTSLYPKLLECRSNGQITMSKQIKARNKRTIQQNEKLLLRIEEHKRKRSKLVSLTSKMDAFLLKAVSPK